MISIRLLFNFFIYDFTIINFFSIRQKVSKYVYDINRLNIKYVVKLVMTISIIISYLNKTHSKFVPKVSK